MVEELCLSEIFRHGLIDILLDLTKRLLADGELAMARALRRKILDKHELDWVSSVFMPVFLLITVDGLADGLSYESIDAQLR